MLAVGRGRVATATSKSSVDSIQVLLLSLPLAGQNPRGTGPLGSHNSLAMIPHPVRMANSMPHCDHPPRFHTKRISVPDSILQLSSWASSTRPETTMAARDPGTCSSALLGAEPQRRLRKLSSNCNSQTRPALGNGAKERGRSVIGETPSVLLIGSWSWLREVVGLATGRFWESEMEGFVSNLMVCNLAYSGKLEELKKEILDDKSLATRTDQVKQRWGLSSGGSDDVDKRGCSARPWKRPVP